MVSGGEQLVRRLTAAGLQNGRVGSRMLRRWQLVTVRLAKERVPKRTGNLQRSIHPGPVGVTAATVEASASYAGYVEFGTRPHTIVPVRARVLAWGGARRLTGSLRTGARPTNFARLVHHPGTRPRPFLMSAGQQALEEANLAAEIVVAWNEAA